MNNISHIESTVMRRVQVARVVRALLSNVALALVLFTLALYGVGREVWVAHVFQNAPHGDVLAVARFFLAAFIDTRLIVQALCLTTLAAFVWLMRDLVKVVKLQPVSF
jgi:hypothetical protein